MLERFYPTQYVESIYHIDYKDLLKRGKKVLLIDLDNTLAPFDIEKPTEEILELFKNLKKQGFRICIVSNNKGERVQIFTAEMDQKIYPKAKKPRREGITKAMEMCYGNPKNSVMIGDQMFTDVWVANRIGMESILVKPIADRDEFTVKLKRGLEKKVFNRYVKEVLENESK